jgi:hypothetical protein
MVPVACFHSPSDILMSVPKLKGATLDEVPIENGAIEVIE